eukprot:Anaeramoba_ignava/c8594_g1_i1.p1 GENE.c8594_g1_i1~~c8594_g1_i1.p1  ORF type:complete len:103 (+),score=49.66 c8594_g1_i1:167-475(+)
MWIQEIQKYGEKNVAKLIVGNKADLVDKKVISTEKAKSVADSFGIPWLETSAKNSTGIEQAFLKLAETIKETQDISKPKQTKPSISVVGTGKPKKKSKCVNF